MQRSRNNGELMKVLIMDAMASPSRDIDNNVFDCFAAYGKLFEQIDITTAPIELCADGAACSRELDDEQFAALCGLYHHPDDGELDDEQWDYLCRAARAHDAKVLKLRERREADALKQSEQQAAHNDAASISTTSAVDFLKALHAHTTGPIYVCSFTNERGAGPERRVITREPDQITRFMDDWDRVGRGMFFCVGALEEGAKKRNKETVAETPCVFVDIDFAKVDGKPDLAEVLRQLARLKYQPSITVASGNGVHAYWLLCEPLATQEHIERIEAALRQLADLVAGDLPVCEVARVLRLPGSHNAKDGAWTEVTITSFDPGRRYEFDDLEEWFSEQSPIMLRKERERGKSVGETDDAYKFFEEYGKKLGFKPPIDVEARLKNMMYMGAGDSSIHQTQIQCAASMLSRGASIDEVVSTLLAFTRIAAGEYGARWNWKREERNIRRDCEKWVKDHPPEERKKKAAKPELKAIEGGKSSDTEKPQMSGNNVLAAVITPAPPKPGEMHIAIGSAVLAYMSEQGEQLINTKDGSWFHSTKNVWELRTDGSWLNVRVEGACVGMGLKSGTKIVNEARNWILRHPELWRETIPWDQHGKIPTRSGLIDPKSGELEPARPDHFCTWRIECDYDPDAKCPWWETMIADMFGDREPDERDALVGVVQELMGAALIDKKSRALSKACVFHGPENRAKSGVLDVVSGLFGHPISAPIGSVESTHGLMPFVRRAPWILHEAFGGQWLFASVVKAIITGEPVQINIKNGPMLTQVVRSPIFWATNHGPQFKEATRAIVDRMVVIEVTRQFDPSNPVGTAAEAIKRGFSKPGEFIVATELPGVLNWAIAGLRRALERGFIETPNSVKATADAIHRESNLAAGFIEDCVEFDPMARIRVPDFCLALSVWFLQEKGEDRRLPTNDSIGRAMKALGDPRIGMDTKEMRDMTSRFYCGIALNKAGLKYHKTGFESLLFEGKAATVTSPDREVNSLIPAAWDAKASVMKMRKSHPEVVEGANDDDG
jgi:phage/plasmid-associated DNA primase